MIVNYSIYRAIIKQFLKEIRREVINEGYRFVLPSNLGAIECIRIDNSSGKMKVVDMQATLENKKHIEELNLEKYKSTFNYETGKFENNGGVKVAVYKVPDAIYTAKWDKAGFFMDANIRNCDLHFSRGENGFITELNQTVKKNPMISKQYRIVHLKSMQDEFQTT